MFVYHDFASDQPPRKTGHGFVVELRGTAPRFRSVFRFASMNSVVRFLHRNTAFVGRATGPFTLQTLPFERTADPVKRSIADFGFKVKRIMLPFLHKGSLKARCFRRAGTLVRRTGFEPALSWLKARGPFL